MMIGSILDPQLVWATMQLVAKKPSFEEKRDHEHV